MQVSVERLQMQRMVIKLRSGEMVNRPAFFSKSTNALKVSAVSCSLISYAM